MISARPAIATRPKQAPATHEKSKRRESHRDFVEQIVVAFILAFLVRGFEAEAFVIPTGSMAPTLMGMHKDVTCPYCGFQFTINASEEFDQRDSGRANIAAIRSGICGNCHAPVQLDEEPSFNGDRILVMKYHFNVPWVDNTRPKRWDVIVFHYPEKPEVNYIKRLVGLPDEDLRIYHGDILTRPSGSGNPYTLERKPLPHQDAMQMNVWDDRHRPRHLEGMPEWKRWGPGHDGSWSETRDGQFVSEGGSEWGELRYRHLVPDLAQWEALLTGREVPYPPRPRLISDYYAYNSGTPHLRQLVEPIAPHWVGDLTLSFRVEIKEPAGRLRVDLVEAGVTNRVEFDVQTGLAQLYHGDDKIGEPAETPLRFPGSHEIRFANVDGRLTLWVDGGTPFGDGVVYQQGIDGYAAPTQADLDPVRVAASGPSVTVSDLVLKRDIYYTRQAGSWDYEGLGFDRVTTLSDPGEFAAIGKLHWNDFAIRPGSYMMMGDNSPRSWDGRRWTQQDREWDSSERNGWEVPEALLIGKAFFVYWPHGKPIWPDIAINKNLRVPFRPNVERMQWIR
jgi:signal peptidase I